MEASGIIVRHEWLPIRFEDIDEDELRRLINAHALAFRKNDRWISYNSVLNPDAAATEDLRLAAEREYGELEWQIFKLLDVEKHIDFDLYPFIDPRPFIPTPFTKNPIFPHEWRLFAHRSFFPQEVPVYLKLWRDYLETVSDGRHQAYLFEYYLYAQSNQSLRFWQELQDALERVRDHNDTYAQQIMASDLPIEIYRCPSPRIYPAPVLEQWQDNPDSVDYKTDGRYIQLMEDLERLHDLRVRWNRMVPANQWHHSKRAFPFATSTFEQFMSRQDDKLTWELFTWLDEVVRRGLGLFFWNGV